MRRLFHKASDSPLLVAKSPDEVARLRGDGWIWMDLVEPTLEEIGFIGEQFGFDPLSIDDTLDDTLFPKVDTFPDYLFVVVHAVGPGRGDRIGTLELDMFIGADFLVTIHRTRVVGVETIIERVESSPRIAENGPARLAATIAEVGSRRYLPLLDTLEERIERLEDLAVTADAQVIGESQALRRDVIVLRRIVGPQRDVLRQLSVSESPLLGPDALRGFADVYDHLFRLVESLDSYRALLGSVLETYRGAIAERTNEVMKVLTVFSAILLPLSLIAGIYGMNFASIPGSAHRLGFLILVGVMAVIAVGLWVYFARRGFVGGPKLKDLPKAVGLGLVSIGTAPIKVVTGAITGLLGAASDEQERRPTSQPHDD